MVRIGYWWRKKELIPIAGLMIKIVHLQKSGGKKTVSSG